METEVQGRLAKSLHNFVRLTLGVEQQDYQVQRSWSATIALSKPNATTERTIMMTTNHNVFEDLGFPPNEAENLGIRSEIMIKPL